MIETITIKNKKGEKIELDLDELNDLKDELNGLDNIQLQPWPTYYPTIPDYTKTDQPFWQIPPVTCTGTGK